MAAYDTVPKFYILVPSPIANEGGILPNEQSVAGDFVATDYAAHGVASASQSADL